MSELKFKTVDVLARLEHNRDVHLDKYYKAKEDFVHAVRVEFDKMYKQVKELKSDSKFRELKQNLNVPVPVCYVEHYDRAIEMLKLTTDKEIVLDQTEFEQLIMDKWSWRSNFETANVTVGGYAGIPVTGCAAIFDED